MLGKAPLVLGAYGHLLTPMKPLLYPGASSLCRGNQGTTRPRHARSGPVGSFVLCPPGPRQPLPTGPDLPGTAMFLSFLPVGLVLSLGFQVGVAAYLSVARARRVANPVGIGNANIAQGLEAHRLAEHLSAWRALEIHVTGDSKHPGRTTTRKLRPPLRVHV